MPGDLILILNSLDHSRKLFLKEKKRLETLLADFNIQVEHIGSTALPESIGKGIIDVLLLCDSKPDQLKIKDILVKNDYVRGELNKIPDGRLFFSFPPGKTEAGDTHLHLVVKNSNNLESLIFRNYLLDHPEEVERYNQEKQRLAQIVGNNRHEYSKQKSTFIENVMTRLTNQKDLA